MRDFLGEALGRQLANVREATRRIWQVPSLRDPLDQGFEHSSRLLDLLDGLTESLMDNPRRMRLSSQEIYVLLASAYLHAIGLQDERTEPDPEVRRQRYPEIGAEIVRAQGLPGHERFRLDLVGDPSLLEAVAVVVAGHHRTDFSTTEFADFIHEGKWFRPGLLAALLHLADSLDWSYQRVDLDLLQQSLEAGSLPLEQALETWLHYYVSGVRVAEDYIYLSFQLPTADPALRELLVELVEKPLRADFEALEDTLWSHGVRLRFAPLTARPIPTVQPMPAPVKAVALQRSAPPAAAPPPPRLVELVQKVLGTMGWVCDPDPPSTLEDLLIPFLCRRRDDPAAPGRFVICKLGVVERSDIHRALALLPDSCADGLVVAESRVMPSARQALGAADRLRALTLDDLYRELLDFSPYVNRQVEEFAASELARYYQPLGCVRHSRDAEGRLVEDRYDSLEAYVDTWLRESLSGPARNHISILGDYGSGKTSFCRRYAARQGERWRQDSVHERIPLLILLRDFSSTPEVPRLICEALASQYGLENVTFEAFMRFNEDGKLLLLLDGFDEMAERSGCTTAVDNFWELARIVSPESRILLTCRTQYFRSEGEAEAVLFDESSPAHPGFSLKNTAYIDPSDLPNFEIVHLSPLTETEIQRILQSRLGEWESHWRQIQRIYNLQDLAQRPVMLDMIVSSLPQIQEGQILNPANLYRIYTNLWLERDVFKGRTLISPEDRRRFAEDLAMKMLRADEFHSTHEEIRAQVIRQFGFARGEEIEHLESDIRTCNFLSRDAEGNYSFAHKSFMEFFAATRLHRQMTHGQADSSVTINDEIRLFIHYLNVLNPIREEPPSHAPPEGFVWVPPGPCIVRDDGTQFRLTWGKGFFASRYPVTNAQYSRFIARRSIRPPSHWNGLAPPREILDHPVVGVSRTAAKMYASMMGASLPTDEQWQKAARGPDGRRFPWGEDWISAHCNSAEEGTNGTTPVDAYSPAGDSPYGLQDACGNVREWTASSHPHRTAWGGSFSAAPGTSSTLSFLSRDPDYRYDDQGFRIVLTESQALLRIYLQALIDRLDSVSGPSADAELICLALDGGGGSVTLARLVAHERELLLLASPDGPTRSFVRFVTLCIAGDLLHHPDLSFERLADRLGAPRNRGLVPMLRELPLIPVYVSPSQLLVDRGAQIQWEDRLDTAMSRQLGVTSGSFTSLIRSMGFFLVLDDFESETSFLDLEEIRDFLASIRHQVRYQALILYPLLPEEPRPYLWGCTNVMETLSAPSVKDLEICAVPAGRAWLGGDPEDPFSCSDELPLAEHVEELGFFLSRHPITNALFRLFMDDGGYDCPELWTEAAEAGFWQAGMVRGPEDRTFRAGPRDFGSPFNQPDHPVVGVTWYEALAFTRWLAGELDRVTGLPGFWEVLLPSETEWEMAARGGDRVPSSPESRPLAALTAGAGFEDLQLIENPSPRRCFPWGDGPANTIQANFVETGLDATSAVGCFSAGASPYSAEDLAGNVWEWTRSVFEESPDEPWGGTRVLRGGSFSCGARDLRCSTREQHYPDYQDCDIGFRVVLRPRAKILAPSTN